jgi:hypothetical protein
MRPHHPLHRAALSAIGAVVAAAAGAASLRAQTPGATPPTAPARERTTPPNAERPRNSPDSAFSALQARGAHPRAMGVDQYTSGHRFDALPDGGRIELQRQVDDSAGIAQIRSHLREIAAAFARGDFRTPAFVHMRPVPGTPVMAARRAAITYTVRDLPRGGEVRITTRDPEALAAVHAFVAFQRQDHRAGGAGTPQHTPSGHAHAHQHPPH